MRPEPVNAASVGGPNRKQSALRRSGLYRMQWSGRNTALQAHRADGWGEAAADAHRKLRAKALDILFKSLHKEKGQPDEGGK